MASGGYSSGGTGAVLPDGIRATWHGSRPSRGPAADFSRYARLRRAPGRRGLPRGRHEWGSASVCWLPGCLANALGMELSSINHGTYPLSRVNPAILEPVALATTAIFRPSTVQPRHRAGDSNVDRLTPHLLQLTGQGGPGGTGPTHGRVSNRLGPQWPVQCHGRWGGRGSRWTDGFPNGSQSTAVPRTRTARHNSALHGRFLQESGTLIR